MVSGVTHNVGPYLRPKLVNVLADAELPTNSGSLGDVGGDAPGLVARGLIASYE